MSPMNHAALGARRRVRCLLAGYKGSYRVGTDSSIREKLLKSKTTPPQDIVVSRYISIAYIQSYYHCQADCSEIVQIFTLPLIVRLLIASVIFILMYLAMRIDSGELSDPHEQLKHYDGKLVHYPRPLNWF